jgi:plasmid replication initiation protein
MSDLEKINPIPNYLQLELAKNKSNKPIKITSKNNSFLINYQEHKKTVKVDPGEYNLTELQAALKQKVNESFGIGKLSLQLNAAGSDRLIYAETKEKDQIIGQARLDLKA